MDKNQKKTESQLIKYEKDQLGHMHSSLKLLQEKLVRSRGPPGAEQGGAAGRRPGSAAARGRPPPGPRGAPASGNLSAGKQPAPWGHPAGSPDACLPTLLALPQVRSESALPLVEEPKETTRRFKKPRVRVPAQSPGPPACARPGEA